MLKLKIFILYLASFIFFENQVFENQILTFNNQVGTIKPSNKCLFETLPLETVQVIQRLASNMILIISDAKFKYPEWNKRIIKLTKKFH